MRKVHRAYLYDNSVENADAKLQIRFADGKVAKRYVEELLEWTMQIIG
ncbi:MAG: hypothetical protein IJ911_02315 [Salinivirgaceae bacterium]|nr:hypothetical protein [Salinivirgaceae bacterium]